MLVDDRLVGGAGGVRRGLMRGSSCCDLDLSERRLGVEAIKRQVMETDGWTIEWTGVLATRLW